MGDYLSRNRAGANMLKISSLKRTQKIARLSRALSGLGQRAFEKESGVPNIAHIETGCYEPTPAQLEAMCRVAERRLSDIEALLFQYEEGVGFEERRQVHVDGRGRPIRGMERVALQQFESRVRQEVVLGLEARRSQRDAERRIAVEQLEMLKLKKDAARRAVVVTQPGFQTWALSALCAEHSEKMLPDDIGVAREWAELACGISDRMQGPAGLKMSSRGFSAAHLANVERVSSRLQKSENLTLTAKALWGAGHDPDQVLDPGRLLELEASLRKDQRRPSLALDLLARAARVTQRPVHVLLKQGLTHAVRGDYEQAIRIFELAGTGVEGLGDQRLITVQRFNLAANLCQVGRYIEAADLLPEILLLARQSGASIDLIRTEWLEGRIAAGLGNKEMALGALERAAISFGERQMHYQMALALLEASTIQFEMGRVEEVRRISGGLAAVFAAEGVGLEVIAALRLFVDTVGEGTATLGTTQCTLQFLFRGWWDESVKFIP